MRVSLYTLGCKLNQCESEAIADAFRKEGFEVLPFNQDAELIIVNSCTVTSKAEQKTRRMIRKFANSDHKPVVLVTGCYAQLEKEEIEALSEQVVVVSLDDKPSLINLPQFLAHRLISDFDLKEALVNFNESNDISPFDYDAATFSYHSRAFLKIEDGCDNQCAFCRVTIARGDAVSLEHDEVVKRTLALEEQGYKEIVLTGVNISAYQSGSYDLAKLLTLLLEELNKETKVRLSSLEPDKLDKELIEVFKDHRIQSHFHLPIQVASNKVLQRVNRNYDISRLYEAVKLLREVKDDPFIAADIITGLPGETEEEFEKSFEVLKELDLAQLHVFPFSPRPQTPLFDATDRVCERTRDERAKLLREFSQKQYRRYLSRQIGKTFDTIVEKRDKKGTWGLTSNYLKVKIVGENVEYEKGAIIKVIVGKDNTAYEQKIAL